MNILREKLLLMRIRVYSDMRAFEELYDEFQEPIFRFLLGKLPERQDAQDLTNEVFLSAWQYLQVKVVGNVSGYLFTVARAKVANHYRSRSAEKQDNIEEHAETLADTKTITAPDALDEKTDMETVKEALLTLHTEYREILALRYFDEMDIPEIAKVLGKSTGAVSVAIHRAKAALQTAIRNRITKNGSK
ncbi:MAG: sigma-70 family RNA polymerase sigma factor [Patescibacteria group bacterium]